jgi:hypothetical protein
MVLDYTLIQQPDTVLNTATQIVDSAPVAVTNHQKPLTAQIHYNTEVPETLLRPHDSVFSPVFDTSDYLLLCNDSVFAPYSELSVRHRESMFVTNTHSRQTTQPYVRSVSASTDWIFVTVISLLALVSVYVNNQKFRLKDIFQSLFDLRVLDRVFRESNIRTVSLLPMVGIYLASISMVVLKTTQYYGGFVVPFPPYILFFTTLAALISFLIVKNGFVRLLGSIFEDRATTMLYIANNNLFYFVGGLVITPLLLLLFFFHPAEIATLKVVFVLVAIIFIIRFVRGMQLILTSSKTSKLYLFYYLCIFEIVPVLIIVKVLFF